MKKTWKRGNESCLHIRFMTFTNGVRRPSVLTSVDQRYIVARSGLVLHAVLALLRSCQAAWDFLLILSSWRYLDVDPSQLVWAPVKLPVFNNRLVLSLKLS